MTLNDTQMQWFADRGFGDGAWGDRYVAYLRAQGLTGTLDDMVTEARARGDIELAPGASAMN